MSKTSKITKDNAVLLLAAAAKLGLPGNVVRVAAGEFSAPDEVHDEAFGGSESEEPKKAPAKKAPARKAPAKKASPRKAPAKKAPKE